MLRGPLKPAKKRAKTEDAGPPRSGRVALVGRPNVGKSTLLNAALELPLAIVSPTPQTTRDALLGVVHRGSAEIGLVDTPGLHKPKTQLGRVMNQAARDAAKTADVVAFVTEVADPKQRGLHVHPGDVALLADVGTDAPVVLVVNKIDLLRDKAQLLPFLEAFAKVKEFAAVVPISARKSSGVERVLDEVAKLLPEGAWKYQEDDITDKPMRYFAAEYVREQILRAAKEEVPHAVAVVVERFEEGATVAHIDATIHVERPGQKRILIGKGGEMMKRIGTLARKRFEELFGHQVNLKLWVRVTPDWRTKANELEELGYGGGK